MRHLAAPGLTALALILASQAQAQTAVGSATTANLQTSTAGDVTIGSGGSITPAGGAAVTIDSNNSVANAGTISTSNIDGTTGIAALGGHSGTIANSGTITLDESYAATDTNGDGIVEAPFAQGSGRTGIALTGNGVFTGSVTNSGTITIKGNQSAAIASDIPIVGGVTSSGSLSVLGNNSYGIRLGAVSGNVVVAGATTVSGANSAGVALNGDIGGGLIVHNTISTTGYTTTTVPTSASTLTALDTEQGSSALIVGGNVGGGVLLAAAPTDTSDTTIDSDADGIADAGESTAAISTYGTAPALRIGAADRATTLGTVAGTTSGLVIRGSVTGTGVMPGVDATGAQIGGLGGAVTISGGILNTGTVSAVANGATARALALGAGATVPSLSNAGTISAQSASTSGGTARAIAIGAGATLPAIDNSGTISATVGTSTGSASAIVDQSGTLARITNSGAITATDQSGTAVAIDTRANAAGFSYSQSAASTTATGGPTLTGAVLTGDGADSVSASAGKISSAMALGAGDDRLSLSGAATFTGSAAMGSGNDVVSLADTSSFSGTIDFGSGADTLVVSGTATFSGQLTSSAGNVALVNQGGTVRFTGTGPTSLASLASNGGTIGLVIDPASGAHTLINVAGATTIGAPTTLSTSFASLPSAATSYTVLQSGSLTGSANLKLAIDSLPYLLNGTLQASDTSGTVAIAIAPKSAAELGLNRSETAAYPVLYREIAGNGTLSTLFSGLTSNDQIQQRLRQMLPDHAGGVFQLLSLGAERLAPGAEPMPSAMAEGMRIWGQQAFWTAHQDGVDTPGYHGFGWGLTGGADVAVGALGRVGVTLGYIFGNVHDGSASGAIAHQFQVGGYWAFNHAGLQLTASGSAGYVSLSEERNLSSLSTSVPVLLSSDAHWHGLAFAGSAKASYELAAGHFYLRPQATASFFRLHESGHSGSGGGSAFDLTVDARTSEELAALGELAAGVHFGSDDPEETSVRLEISGGRRALVHDAIGATTARFADGNAFTLLPEDRGGTYVGAVNASVGSNWFRVVASGRVEQRSGYRDVIGQVALRGAF